MLHCGTCGEALPVSWNKADIFGRPACPRCSARGDEMTWPEHAPEPRAERATEPKEA